MRSKSLPQGGLSPQCHHAQKPGGCAPPASNLVESQPWLRKRDHDSRFSLNLARARGQGGHGWPAATRNRGRRCSGSRLWAVGFSLAHPPSSAANGSGGTAGRGRDLTMLTRLGCGPIRYPGSESMLCSPFTIDSTCCTKPTARARM